MTGDIRFRPLFLLSSLLYAPLLCLFYYKYVPLIPSFQVVMIPILLVTFTLTVVKKEWGILFFVFAFPLVNNLPYFFRIDTDIPHAPAALVLFLVFFLGWLFHNSFYFSRLSFDQEVFRPIILFSLIIISSGIVTYFRYANFFPFLTEDIHELIVNVNYVRVGGAIMSVVFACLNYLSGFVFLAHPTF